MSVFLGLSYLPKMTQFYSVLLTYLTVSFSWLRDSPCVNYPFLCWWTLGCFQFLSIMSKPDECGQQWAWRNKNHCGCRIQRLFIILHNVILRLYCWRYHVCMSSEKLRWFPSRKSTPYWLLFMVWQDWSMLAARGKNAIINVTPLTCPWHTPV